MVLWKIYKRILIWNIMPESDQLMRLKLKNQSGLEECRMMEAQILEMAEIKIKQIQSKSIRDKEDRITHLRGYCP